MTSYILTGMPGCGKTSIIEELEKLGYHVIKEVATDVIASEQALKNLKPWEPSEFKKKVVIFHAGDDIAFPNDQRASVGIHRW